MWAGAAWRTPKSWRPRRPRGWARDREFLWNRVEAGESRKDSQLARLIEIGLPRELGLDENVALLRDYIETEFVSQGMIADFSVRMAGSNPHSHILLTLRRVTSAGFGPKERRWNGKTTLLQWRAAWAERANEHLARAGHRIRIDHRTLEAQQIELAPGRRAGLGKGRQSDETLPGHLNERICERKRVGGGRRQSDLEDPAALLRAFTHQQPIFTEKELIDFLRFRTRDTEQLDAAFSSGDTFARNSGPGVRPRGRSPVHIPGPDRGGEIPDAADGVHGEPTGPRDRGRPSKNSAASQFSLDDEQRRVFDYLLEEGDIKALAIAPGGRQGGASGERCGRRMSPPA